MKMTPFGQRATSSKRFRQPFRHYQLAKEYQFLDFGTSSNSRTTYISCVGQPFEICTVFKILEKLLCLHKYY